MGPKFALQGLRGVVRDASSSDVQESRAYLGFRVEDEFAFIATSRFNRGLSLRVRLRAGLTC